MVLLQGVKSPFLGFFSLAPRMEGAVYMYIYIFTYIHIFYLTATKT